MPLFYNKEYFDELKIVNSSDENGEDGVGEKEKKTDTRVSLVKSKSKTTVVQKVQKKKNKKHQHSSSISTRNDKTQYCKIVLTCLCGLLASQLFFLFVLLRPVIMNVHATSSFFGTFPSNSFPKTPLLEQSGLILTLVLNLCYTFWLPYHMWLSSSGKNKNNKSVTAWYYVYRILAVFAKLVTLLLLVGVLVFISELTSKVSDITTKNYLRFVGQVSIALLVVDSVTFCLLVFLVIGEISSANKSSPSNNNKKNNDTELKVVVSKPPKAKPRESSVAVLITTTDEGKI